MGINDEIEQFMIIIIIINQSPVNFVPCVLVTVLRKLLLLRITRHIPTAIPKNQIQNQTW